MTIFFNFSYIQFQYVLYTLLYVGSEHGKPLTFQFFTLH